MQLWKTNSRQTILDHNKFLRVEQHVVTLPDGTVIEDWPWLDMPDYVNVVVETENGRFLFFRQFKYGVGEVTLATPGGYLEPGEDPLLAAQRELLEETGYEATNWYHLGSSVVDGNRGAGTGHLFLARQARPVAAPDADDLEEQEMLLLTRSEVETAVSTHQFKLMSWLTAVLLALRTLDNL
ncbi:MAG: NUDIX hydrolase [Anaerolineales bacterium]|nr:NUDIX hydrolase [Anaerolineales bacterium]